ncbi:MULTISPECIES: hypothetical protein [unclassified Psychrobacter]|uniref:hypothetical protein n=1 Tax=unclassified Psychrobacter TaxID=196806 RepID=UPI0025ECACEF|nr:MULTISPECIES: hypothetical protein [unclassified Psychrobacter]
MSHATNPSKYTRRYLPCHPLAQYAITQIDILELRGQDIIKAMGYPLKHTIPACERLRHVLSNKRLGLDGSYVDKYFTADEFLAKLFAVLDLPYEPFAEDIAQIKDEVAQGSKPQPRYRLQADVDFNFDGSSNWLSRWGASFWTHIELPSGFAKLDEAERSTIIKNSIRAHYQEHGANVPYNGVIKGYRLIIEQQDKEVDRIEYNLPKSKSV